MSALSTTVTAASVPASMSGSFAAFSSRLPRVLQLVTGALRNPTDDPMAALLAIGLIGIVLILIVALVWLVASFVRPSESGPSEGGPAAEPLTPEERAVRRRRRRVFGWVLLLALLPAAFVGWENGTSNAACASCHVMKRAVASNAKDTHAKAACRACHIAPGARGAYVAAARGVRNLGVQISGAATGAMPAADVSNAACLTCHSSVKTSVTVAKGIRMRHSDVLGVGYSCIDCHNTAGHGRSVRRVRAPQMAQCIQCHDGTKATNECRACHSRDIGAVPGNPTDGYMKREITTDGCRGCHSMTTCIQCHGLELPHSPEFAAGFHARKALLEPKMCAKCHTISACRKCHQNKRPSASGVPSNPHAKSVPEFVTWHSTAKGNGLGSCSCHGQDRQKFCDYCHGPQPSR